MEIIQVGDKIRAERLEGVSIPVQLWTWSPVRYGRGLKNEGLEGQCSVERNTIYLPVYPLM